MSLSEPNATMGLATLADEQIVTRVCAGEHALFELLMRRHNRRIFRTARAIVRDDAEAEDVMQEAYVRAFQHLAQFAGRASFATWLTRIAVHEALAHRRRNARAAARTEALEAEEGDEAMGTPSDEGRSPEQRASDRELDRVLEHAIDALPEHYRTVFVLRAVEELSVAETAACLEIPEDTVKTRLHRARRSLQDALLARSEAAIPEVFAFYAPRCDRVVAAVLRKLGIGPVATAGPKP